VSEYERERERERGRVREGEREGEGGSERVMEGIRCVFSRSIVLSAKAWLGCRVSGCLFQGKSSGGTDEGLIQGLWFGV